MNKKNIIKARNLSVDELLEKDFTIEELYHLGEITKQFYTPSDCYEFFDEEKEMFYNIFGQQLRSLEDYNPHSEGYTPFGDE